MYPVSVTGSSPVPPIPARALGDTGVNVSRLAYGCGTSWSQYGTFDEALATLGRALDLGITYIAENRELFPDMTVLENLKLGAYSKNARPHEKDNLEKVFALFPRLKDRRKQYASTMSGGEARMLAVARGLMSNPDFLCIDEPSLGLQPSLRHEIFSTIKQINEQGKTVLLVEQNIPQIAELADRIYVMEEGQITFEGSKDEALGNEDLKEIFLGM